MYIRICVCTHIQVRQWFVDDLKMTPTPVLWRELHLRAGMYVYVCFAKFCVQVYMCMYVLYILCDYMSMYVTSAHAF